MTTAARLPFAEQLRQSQTDAENLLWRHLRTHRLDGHKFKRQQPFGLYIVDFVCFERRLVIEVDGGQHLDSATDVERDKWLGAQGFRVLRFWNNDVLQNIESVLEQILNYLAPSSPSPPPLSFILGRCGRGHQGRGALPLEAIHVDETDPSLSPHGKGVDGEGGASLSPRGRGTEGEGAQ